MIKKVFQWIIYFICLLAPFTILLPIENQYYFIFILVAFGMSLLTTLIANRIKDDTYYVIMPAKTVLKRGLIHPEISLLCATALYAAFGTAYHHLGTDFDFLSRPINYFREGISAITGGMIEGGDIARTFDGIFMVLPAIALIIFLFKFLFSAHTKSLGWRVFWYVIFYGFALANAVLPRLFGTAKGVLTSDYIAALNNGSNKLFVILLVVFCVLYDVLITINLFVRIRKFHKLAENRYERLHDIDDIDEYTHSQLIEQEAYERHLKKIDKEQAKLNKKLEKDNKRLHKKTEPQEA